MDSRVHGNDGRGAWRGCAEFLCETMLLVFSIIFCFLTFSFSLRSVCFFFLSFFSSSSRTRGSIVRRVLWFGITASLSVLLFGCSMLLPIAASAFPNATSGVCGRMDSCVRGNDGRGAWRGCAEFLCETVLLVFSIIFCFLTFSFSLRSVCFFFLSFSRHPREGGDPSYSECCSSLLPLHCQCCYWFCSMLWRVHFQMRHPARVDEWIPVCTGMTVGGVVGMC
ncbi:hypothetical protein VV99743_03301 [Vibrio vulnificus]|nr:hypothetical protein VV99743_03301 [Vibrio vulnificus]